MGAKVKVRVFAAYQLGIGMDAKIVGDESKNTFDVTFGHSSDMIRQIEEVLNRRHADDVKMGLVPIVHHFQIISF